MNDTTTTTVTAGTLDAPGARLYYEVRGSGPLIALVGAPMAADSFAPLADLLATDHTVLTADPRAIKRSSVTTAAPTRRRSTGPTTCPGCWPTWTPGRPPCSARAAARSPPWRWHRRTPSS